MNFKFRGMALGVYLFSFLMSYFYQNLTGHSAYFENFNSTFNYFNFTSIYNTANNTFPHFIFSGIFASIFQFFIDIVFPIWYFMNAIASFFIGIFTLIAQFIVLPFTVISIIPYPISYFYSAIITFVFVIVVITSIQIFGSRFGGD